MGSKARLSTTLGAVFAVLAAVAGAQGPLGYWPLDGDGVDISGNGLDGTLQGNVTATADRNGVSTSALEFGGAGTDLVDLGDPPELRLTGAMTLASWAYLRSGNANNGRIIAKMGGGGSRSWSLCVEASLSGIVNRPNFQISPDGTAVIGLPARGSAPTDQWFHMAGVYRPGEAMEIYLNGQLDDTLTTGVPASQFSDNGQPVYIGHRPACGNCGWFGALDDVRVYDRALNASEIQDLLGDVTSPTAPVNLTAQPGDRLVRLAWDAVPGIVDGYRIYRSETSGGGYAEVTTTTSINHTVTGLTNGTPYYFVVTAFNVAGEGPRSNEASATPQSNFNLRCRMWETLEWIVDSPSWSGNPFDVVARVSFDHEGGGARHVTEMFHDGGAIWAFRFTGTRMGTWTYVSTCDGTDGTSNVASLHGLTGSVRVDSNPDPRIRGFMTHAGNQFAIQSGDDAHLEGYILQVYMNAHHFDATALSGWSDTRTTDFVNEARDNGSEVIFAHVCNQWFKLGALRWDGHSSDEPDPETFRILEDIIRKAHSLGARIHIWAWGDESRRWTPLGVPGGANGYADRRVQRYIAARLGPLPGWSMGYGFDLNEWTNSAQRNAWAEYMHDHLGWDHMLCTRAYYLNEVANNMDSYSGFDRGVEEISTTYGGPLDYFEVLDDLNSDASRVHFYEERHSYLRDDFHLDMDGSRRLLWWKALAGGVGGWHGFYTFSPHPYPNPEQLRTYRTFWLVNRRFRLGMAESNALSGDGDTRVLGTGDHQYIFYREDAASIQMDLSAMPAPEPAVAVDAKLEYAEVDLGVLDPTSQTITLPYSSDWAVAVGVFEAKASALDRPVWERYR